MVEHPVFDDYILFQGSHEKRKKIKSAAYSGQSHHSFRTSDIN